MSHVMNRSSPLSRLERTIKNRQMIVLNMRCPIDSAGSVDVRNDRIRLLMRVTKFEQCAGHSVVDDLDHPSTNELLILNQSQIRLNARSIAIHHESYSSCWR